MCKKSQEVTRDHSSASNFQCLCSLLKCRSIVGLPLLTKDRSSQFSMKDRLKFRCCSVLSIYLLSDLFLHLLLYSVLIISIKCQAHAKVKGGVVQTHGKG